MGKLTGLFEFQIFPLNDSVSITKYLFKFQNKKHCTCISNKENKQNVSKGPYLNYVINHGGGVVVVKMFDRNDKQGIVQDDIDDDPHRGG